MEFDSIFSLSDYTVYLVLLTIITIIIFIKWTNKNDLPEPFGLPIIGHSFSLAENPAVTLSKWAEKYGNVYKIRLGMQPYVVINGYTANKETLNDLSSAFSSRPQCYSFATMFKEGIDFCGPWDEKFKQSRKTAVRTLGILSSIRTPYFKQLVDEATNNFLSKLKQNYQDKFINPEKDLIQMMGHVISGILFGKLAPDSYNDDEYYDLLFQLNRYEKEFFKTGHLDSYPILALLLGWRNYGLKTQATKFRNFFIQQIEKHQKSDIENIPNALDSILQFHKEQSDGMSIRDIAGHMIFLLEGGVETIPSFILWFFILLGERIELQDRLYNHIKERIGNQPITFNDFSKLPYIEALIFEIHRYAPIAPLGFFHSASENVTYKGKTIPKGIGIISNVWSIHHEQDTWDNPHEFNPDRFLKSGGEEMDSNLAGKLMGFGTGRRRCIGESMTRLILFVFVGTILQHFKFEADNPSSTSLKNLENFGLARPFPFGIKVTPRH